MDIHIITEGATEREVGDVLYKRSLLSNNGKPKPPEWKRTIGGSREGYDQVIGGLCGEQGTLEILRTKKTSEQQRVLLLFDQEDASSPQDRCRKIEADLRWSDPQQFWKTFTFAPFPD